MRFYTTEQLGENQGLTPEGFLLCLNVPIARTGSMVYGPNETPIEAGPDGIVKVHREAEEVFRPEFVASFSGKPLVDNHPEGDVNPTNWKQLAVGTVMNPRQGSGMQQDLLIADIVVSDEAAIKAVREGKREVSCGYDADYDEIAPGEGKQKNMVGNHVALVESGRCGSRCAIGDQKTKTGDCAMAKDKKGWMDQIRAAFKAKDEGKMEEALKEADDALPESGMEGLKEEHTHIHMHSGDEFGGGSEGQLPTGGPAGMRAMTDEAIEGRFKGVEDGLKKIGDSIEELKKHVGMGDAGGENAEIEGQLEEEAPAGTGDKARKAKDSALLSDSFQETVALAEILVPGIAIPAYDGAAAPKKTLDQVCALRKTALDLANAQPEGRGLIEQINGKPLELAGMKCSAVRTLFRSVAAAKKAANSAVRTGDLNKTAAGIGVKGAVRTPAELNKRMEEHYKGQAA